MLVNLPGRPDDRCETAAIRLASGDVFPIDESFRLFGFDKKKDYTSTDKLTEEQAVVALPGEIRVVNWPLAEHALDEIIELPGAELKLGHAEPDSMAIARIVLDVKYDVAIVTREIPTDDGHFNAAR